MKNKYYCKEINCNNEVCYITYKYGQGRCMFCAFKGKLNGFYGKYHTEKTRNQMSKNHADISGDKNPFERLEVRKKLSKTLKGRKIVWSNKIRQTMLLNGTTKGKKNGRYIDGKSKEPYSLDFGKIRHKVLKRDDYKCQYCNMTEEEQFIILGRSLSVHHIDYNKKNDREENLITLCHDCHLRTNFNRDYWYAYFTYIMETIEK